MAAFWIDWAIRSSVLLAAGLLAAVLMRKTSAKHRHTMLVVILLASAMLPLLSAALGWHELNVFPWQKEVGDSPVLAGGAAANAASANVTWLLAAFLIPAALLIRMAAVWVRLSVLSGKTRKRASIDAVAVHVSDDPRIKTAMTWGFVQPRIVIPASSQSWPQDRMASVLQHEMAHIVRRDWAVQQLAYIAVCFLWYNPLAWMVLKQLLLEAERAADDMVLQRGISPADYAQHLLDCARNMTRKQQTSYAGVHATKNGNLETRLRYILDPECRLKAQASLPIAASLALAVLSLPILLVRLEGQAVRQIIPPTVSGDTNVVAFVQNDELSEGGQDLPCTVNTATIAALKSKVSSTAAYSQTTLKRGSEARKSRSRKNAESQLLTRRNIFVSVSGSPKANGRFLSKQNKTTVREVVVVSTDSFSKPTKPDMPATTVFSGNVMTITARPSTIHGGQIDEHASIGIVAEVEGNAFDQYDLESKTIKVFVGKRLDQRSNNVEVREINLRLLKSIWRTAPISIIDIDKTNSAGKPKLIASHLSDTLKGISLRNAMIFVPPAYAYSMSLVG